MEDTGKARPNKNRCTSNPNMEGAKLVQEEGKVSGQWHQE